MKRAVSYGMLGLLSIASASCLHVTSDPVQVNIKQDVTIGVDKALEDFFAFQEKSTTGPATTTTAPATQTAQSAGEVK